MSLHGIPKLIIADQALEFNSNMFKDFCDQYDIQLHVTSFQQSTNNSPVERLHSTLTEIYRIIKEKQRDSSHEDILNETIINIHSTTNFTPYELFSGRTYKFLENVKFNNEHEFVQKLNEFQANIYPKIKEKIQNAVSKNIDKLNKNRESPPTLEENEMVYRKENRRNKLTPRFSIHKIKRNNKVTVITLKNQKLHKSKIKRKRKFQVNHRPQSENCDARSVQSSRDPSNETGTSQKDTDLQ